MKRPTRVLSLITTAALTAAALSVTTSGGAQSAPTDNGAAAAVDRLRADSSGSPTIVRAGGVVTFVGTDAGDRMDNPSVSPSTSVSAAARSHLTRYGAALGTTRRGTGLREHRVLTTDVGHTVRYRQEVAGLPVLGGDVVVSIGQDRELTSLLSTMSTAAAVPSASLSQSSAATSARAAIGRDRTATVTAAGRWLLDPAVIGMSSRQGPRGVYRFTVRAGVDIDREVFVDDRTGAPLLAFDNLHQANRIVCDNANVPQNPNLADTPCTVPARSEGGAATGIADVDNVYSFVGATSDLYQSIGVDLTDLIGKDVGGTKKIASTVRLCYTGSCPYANAFWNGTEMYYGTGLTVDDITGHELTHGVTDRTSELLYWGQSGAINESISDIVGEIVDHRTATPGDSSTNWQLGEESSIGVIRDLADPTLEGHPDRTQSPLYVDDLGGGLFYDDNGGVHQNSGVGNKTAYLIMEGGTFNGRTITGIDGGDSFPKTARLYQLVNESMSSGADFADLGLVLVQACNTLVGTHGFTAADCTEVGDAVLATELADTPANAPQPADASTTCPAGQVRTVLFDSETGSQASKFTGSAEWTYGEDPFWGSNAHSGQDSWSNAKAFSSGAQSPRAESMTTAGAIAVPSAGTTYLAFHGWYFFDFTINSSSGAVTERWDGGTVEVDDLGDASGPLDAAALPWVNGPTTVLNAGAGNPAQGRQVFSADSAGWIGSRVDLSSFAGRTIKPQFTVSYDNFANYIGWFLDDITVYTCQTPPPVVLKVTAGTVTVAGKLLVGKRLKAKTVGWLPAGVTFAYQWLRNGKVIKKATAKKYTLTNKDKGKKLSVRVIGAKPSYTSATVTSAKTKRIKNL